MREAFKPGGNVGEVAAILGAQSKLRQEHPGRVYDWQGLTSNLPILCQRT